MLNCRVLAEKLRKIKQKNLLVQHEFVRAIFFGRNHFEEDGTQNYLVFQPLNKYFKVITKVIPFSIETSKCSGSCNNINYPYAKICVPDIVKNLNVKVFNLMSRTNKARRIE